MNIPKSSTKRKLKAFNRATNSLLQNKDNELEDAAISASEDEEDDTRKHQKLLEAVECIKGKKRRIFQRNEAGQDITEFNLNEVGKEKVKLDDLVKSSKKTSSFVRVKRQLAKVSRNSILPVPLSKPETEKIKRKVAYNKVSREVSKWDPIVKRNRSAVQMIFPLKQPEFRLETTEEVAKRFQDKNAFEEEIAKLLNKSENTLQPGNDLTVAEEKALKAMSVEESKERLAHLQRTRALISYQSAKARRQKKIKSKRFHRVLKKEKRKILQKQFEQLQKTDPDAANEKLEELNKQRILERVTLKHKSTGKWAKNHKQRAKYCMESRSSLKEQLELGRKLSEKVVPSVGFIQGNTDVVNSNPEEVEEMQEDSLLALYKQPQKNAHHDLNIENVVESLKKIKKLKKPDNTEFPKQICKSSKRKNKARKLENASNTVEVPVHKELVEDFRRQRATSQDPEEQQDNTEEAVIAKKVKICNPPMNLEKESNTKTENYVCEPEFSLEAKVLESIVPDDITLGGDDDEVGDSLNIQQAFADEDFVQEFIEDKKATQEKEQPQGINLFLPGWGSWGGSGISVSQKKRKRFFINPISAPRRDRNLGNVIISEEKDTKASAHQVRDLPFPFTNVDQFQNLIRQPIGSTWNSQTAFKNLVAPKVITKIGKIIHPIDADALVLQKEVEVKGFSEDDNRFVKWKN